MLFLPGAVSFACLLFVAAAIGMGCTPRVVPGAPQTTMNPYSQRVKFGENDDLVFPDFTLRYVDKTKIVSAPYPRGFTYFNFVVKAGGNEQKIRWSSGTGDIGPLDFYVDGKPFWLELQISDTLGPLAPDELVIVPRPAP